MVHCTLDTAGPRGFLVLNTWSIFQASLTTTLAQEAESIASSSCSCSSTPAQATPVSIIDDPHTALVLQHLDV
jgi:hypothetical protein